MKKEMKLDFLNNEFWRVGLLLVLYFTTKNTLVKSGKWKVESWKY